MNLPTFSCVTDACYGLYVDFGYIPESEWIDWISQGYSPAINIFYGYVRGNINHSKEVGGWTMYRFGCSSFPSTRYV